MEEKKFFVGLASVLIVSLIIYVLQVLFDYLIVKYFQDFSIHSSNYYRIIELRTAYPFIIPFLSVISILFWVGILRNLKKRNLFWDYLLCALSFLLVSFLITASFGNMNYADSYTVKFFAIITLIGVMFPSINERLRLRFGLCNQA